jgi:hypothetical protein
MRLWYTVLVIATVVIAPAALLASDPMDGTWELDVSASRFNPGPGRTRDTRTYKIDGDRIHMTGTVVHADGRVENIQFEAAGCGIEEVRVADKGSRAPSLGIPAQAGLALPKSNVKAASARPGPEPGLRRRRP